MAAAAAEAAAAATNVVPIVATQDDGFSDAAVDANSKVLRGTLVTFSDGHWYRGKEKVEIKEGTRYAAVGTAHFWQKWQDKKPVETIMREPGKKLRERNDLGDLDEGDWESRPRRLAQRSVVGGSRALSIR